MVVAIKSEKLTFFSSVELLITWVLNLNFSFQLVLFSFIDCWLVMFLDE